MDEGGRRESEGEGRAGEKDGVSKPGWEDEAGMGTMLNEGKEGTEGRESDLARATLRGALVVVDDDATEGPPKTASSPDRPLPSPSSSSSKHGMRSIDTRFEGGGAVPPSGLAAKTLRAGDDANAKGDSKLRVETERGMDAGEADAAPRPSLACCDRVRDEGSECAWASECARPCPPRWCTWCGSRRCADGAAPACRCSNESRASSSISSLLRRRDSDGGGSRRAANSSPASPYDGRGRVARGDISLTGLDMSPVELAAEACLRGPAGETSSARAATAAAMGSSCGSLELVGVELGGWLAMAARS